MQAHVESHPRAIIFPLISSAAFLTAFLWLAFNSRSISTFGRISLLISLTLLSWYVSLIWPRRNGVKGALWKRTQSLVIAPLTRQMDEGGLEDSEVQLAREVYERVSSLSCCSDVTVDAEVSTWCMYDRSKLEQSHICSQLSISAGHRGVARSFWGKKQD